MTGSTDIRQQSASCPANMDGYQSDISLTSTIEDNDSNKEWDVDDVIAVDDEYPEENGGFETRYLVMWTGYELGDATWEPEAHLDSELLQQWEERSARQERGEEPEFDVQIWRDARIMLDQAKQERHHKRNAKRKRLGLVLTEPIKDEEEEFDPVLDPAQESESGVEATEEDTIVDKVNDILTSSTSATVVKPVQRPGIFKGLPAQNSSVSKKRTPSEKTRQSSQAAQPASSVHNAAARPSQTPQQLSRTRDTLPSATGYQGTARKSSSTNVTRPLIPPNQFRSSFAAKFGGGKKILTAKRSINSAAVTGNVFISGKTRKPRQKLGEAMVDPCKEPKAFQMRRIARKAELQSRGKADAAAPDISRLKEALFDPTHGPPPKKTSRDRQVPGSDSGSRTSSLTTEIPAVTQGSVGLIMQSDNLVTGQAAATLKEKEPPKKKSRKTVRFFDADDASFVDEPMQIDSVSPSTVQDEMSPRETEIPQGNCIPKTSHNMIPQSLSPSKEENNLPNRLSIVMPQPNMTQAVGMDLVLYAAKAKKIRVHFNSLPRDSTIPWLSSFQSQEEVVISHECFARTFIEQIDFLQVQSICSGFLTCNEPVVEQIADHLRVSLSGLFCLEQDYNLVIYPTKCEDWRTEIFDPNPTSPEGVALKYAFFSSQSDLRLLLRPCLQSSACHIQDEWKIEHTVRERLFRTLFGLEYRDLVLHGQNSDKNESSVIKSQHTFYLAFPGAKQELCRSIYAWVREVNPECKVYTTYQTGAWIPFLNVARGGNGIILVHEALAWTVRHFPGLHNILRESEITMWCLSEALHSQPMYPSQPVAPTIPGTMSLTHLFPQGHAILITPSFMVSEPENTKNIFDWYIKYKIDLPTYKLVTAWNIQHYLHALALDKAQQCERLTDNRARKEMRQECSVLFETAAVVSDKFLIRESRTWTYSNWGEDDPLIYADECIDPNDEQSLVNWFGWWSTLRADQYRHFYVIGSMADVIESTSTKRVRHLPIPQYASSCNNNPDAIYERSVSKPIVVGSHIYGDMDQSTTGPLVCSVLLNDNDHAALFSEQLYRVDEAGGARLRVYAYPVSWADLPMADHFGDHTAEFARISDWFNWTPPWNKHNDGRWSPFNTSIGFFYTIVDDWDSRLFPRGRKPRRHPWVAIYRPFNVHLTGRPYTKSEVIIWDMSAEEKFGNQDQVHERDLTYMQRQVIEYIREHGPDKNPNTPLQRAFLGGFRLPNSPSRFPIDVTFAYLKETIPIVEQRLPGWDLKLLQEGYKSIVLDGGQPSTTARYNPRASPTPLDGISHQPKPMEVDQPEGFSDDEQSNTVIFHPPRGTQKPILGKNVASKCHNDLYESARLARLRNKKATTMEYAYKPTLEWYEQQRSEGRGHEHIHVGDSGTIFKILGIKRIPKATGV